MKKAFVLALAILCVAGFVNQAAAISFETPIVAYISPVDGSANQVDTFPIDMNGKPGNGVSQFNTTNDNFSITVDAALLPDPVINYGIAVTNFTPNPIIFTFIFSTPINIGAVPTVTAASIVGGLTDATGDGVGIAPAAAQFLQVNYVDFRNSQVPTIYGTPTVAVGNLAQFGPGNPGSLYTYGAFVAAPQAGPNGPWDTFSTVLSFALTGNGDIAVLTGTCVIDPVPVPASVLLLGTGLSGLLFLRNRRRS